MTYGDLIDFVPNTIIHSAEVDLNFEDTVDYINIDHHSDADGTTVDHQTGTKNRPGSSDGNHFSNADYANRMLHGDTAGGDLDGTYPNPTLKSGIESSLDHNKLSGIDGGNPPTYAGHLTEFQHVELIQPINQGFTVLHIVGGGANDQILTTSMTAYTSQTVDFIFLNSPAVGTSFTGIVLIRGKVGFRGDDRASTPVVASPDKAVCNVEVWYRYSANGGSTWTTWGIIHHRSDPHLGTGELFYASVTTDALNAFELNIIDYLDLNYTDGLYEFRLMVAEDVGSGSITRGFRASSAEIVFEYVPN